MKKYNKITPTSNSSVNFPNYKILNNFIIVQFLQYLSINNNESNSYSYIYHPTIPNASRGSLLIIENNMNSIYYLIKDKSSRHKTTGQSMKLKDIDSKDCFYVQDLNSVEVTCASADNIFENIANEIKLMSSIKVEKKYDEINDEKKAYRLVKFFLDNLDKNNINHIEIESLLSNMLLNNNIAHIKNSDKKNKI